MLSEYWANGTKQQLEIDEDVIAVRFKEPSTLSERASAVNTKALGSFLHRIELPGEQFTILPVAQTEEPRAVRFQKAYDALIANPAIARVAPVFKTGRNRVLATDRILTRITGFTGDPLAFFAEYKGDVLEENDAGFLVRLPVQRDPLETAAALTARSEVHYAEPDFVILGKFMAADASSTQIDMISNAGFDKQRALRQIRAIDAWGIQTRDATVRIAVLDLGVDYTHADLRPAIVGSYDAETQDAYQEPKPWDAHGTACAGLAAAQPAGGQGMRGVAEGCSILAIRIGYSPNQGGDVMTSDSWICRAIDWAWRNGASILNISWSSEVVSDAVIEALERARTQGRGGRGCVIVVAAGNENGAVKFPGNLPNVLTVSASNFFDEPKTRYSADGETWWGSCFGPEVDLAAPGVSQFTTDNTGESGYNPGQRLPDDTWIDGNYTHNFYGTSAATPLVAGAAAMVLSRRNDLSESEVREIIKSSADKVGSVPYQDGRNDRMGHGRLNVLRAVEAALRTQPEETDAHEGGQ